MTKAQLDALDEAMHDATDTALPFIERGPRQTRALGYRINVLIGFEDERTIRDYVLPYD